MNDTACGNVILVGGEAAAIEYPGPSVLEAGDLASAAGLDFFLGGIAIPSRSREAARIRSKYEHGLRFFTTQVLVDPNDTVDLLQALNGLDVRIFLSFAPITNLRDVEFLEWLGVDVPRNVAWGVEQAGGPAQAAEKMTAMASRVLTDIFDNLPSHPPALGMNVGTDHAANARSRQKNAHGTERSLSALRSEARSGEQGIGNIEQARRL